MPNDRKPPEDVPGDRGPTDIRAGEMLLRDNLISPLQYKRAVEGARANGTSVGAELQKIGAITDEDQVAQFIAKRFGVPSISLSDFEIDAEVRSLIPKELVIRHQVVPINRSGSTLIVAMVDPSDVFAIDDIKFVTKFNIDVVVASASSIANAIEQYYTQGVTFDDIPGLIDDASEDIEAVQEVDDEINPFDIERAAGEAPVVKLVNLMLLDAIRKGASDIHVEPFEKQLRVRYRIDGMLYDVMKPPTRLKHAVTSRLKIMANLDIAERRLPQDGRIKLKMGKGKEMDFRVSICPVLWGEKTVLRLLDKSNLQLDMTKLGFEEHVLRDFKDAIAKPYGMILITGPTGSGKTTTLYSTLSELNKSSHNISTAEDPIEYNLYGINQVQMHDEIGLNFAAALRSFLRQDPDVIMVGEVRDFETAEIAVKAALTGHLVLSTLHTNDAPSTVSRLLNMGIEPFLVASSVNLIGAQRLMRKICSECKAPADVPRAQLIDIGIPPEEVEQIKPMRGTGCRNCTNTGYKGRIAVYEIMTFNEELKEFVLNGASTLELKREAVRHGMKTLRMSALTKFREGVTSLEEVVRVTAPD